MKNDWLSGALDNPKLSPPSPGGPRKATPISAVSITISSLQMIHYTFHILMPESFYAYKKTQAASRGPPPPPTNRAAPAIPNRPGPGQPQGRPGGQLPPPLIPA